MKNTLIILATLLLSLPALASSNGILTQNISSGGGGGGTGTVTNFSFTNGGGFTGTVLNATTTPALSLTYSGGVSSFSGDGTLLSNSASTGAVTATLGNAGAYSLWGNATGSSAAPGYTNSPTVLSLTTSVGGTLTAGGNAALAGTTTVSGVFNDTNSMALSGTITSSGAFNQTGNAALSGTTTISGALNATATASFTGSILGPNGGQLNLVNVSCGNSTAAGAALSTGSGPPALALTGGTIKSATIIGSLSGGNCSAVVDVWKVNAALPSVANTITASALPTLSSQTYHQDSTLTGWTKSVAANDVFMCNVQSVTCDKLSLILSVAR